MSKRKTITRVLLSTTALGLSILGGYKIYSSIQKENAQIEEQEETQYIDNTNDVLTDEPIYAKTLSLNSTISNSDSEADNTLENESTKLASRLYVQHGTYEDKDALRYVVAVPHLNVGVKFIRTLYFEDGETYSKTITPSSAYTAIKAGDGYISPSDLNEDFDEDGIKDTDYQYFVCYTMSGINDDYAKLAVEVQVEDYKESTDDYTKQDPTTGYHIANVAGMTYTASQYITQGSGDFTYEGLNYSYSGNNLSCTGLPEDSSLTSVTIPQYINYKNADVIEKKTVTSIGDSAFIVSDITTINIPNTVTSIGEYAFFMCYGLTSVTIPNGVTTIGDSAFNSCANLTEISISNSVTSIGNYAFANCSNLAKVSIPNSVTSIGTSAFNSCTNLTEASIPNSVTSIGASAFNGCTSLDKITLPFVGGSATENTYLGYLFGAEDYDGNADNVPKSLKTVILGEGCTSIPDYAFSNSGLTSITIPDTVSEISPDAFEGCPIVEATIPALAIDYIPKGSLDKVTITSGEEIGECAFEDCHSLTIITIPDSVRSIGARAFYLCTNLSSITIPDSVVSIGASAFQGCYSLETITIPSGVTIINDSTFTVCNYLTSITIPSGVTSIGSDAFWECAMLQEINFGGTKEQWDAIEKGTNWDLETPSYTIHCIDGDKDKE